MSQPNQLKITELRNSRFSGVMGLCPCPGTKGRALSDDVEAIADWGAAAVLTLLPDQELALCGAADLGLHLAAHDITWHQTPIFDFGVPDPAFEAAWTVLGGAIRARLADGERVLIHCRYGIGRTGTIAARLLVEMGTPADEAIDAVRAVRPGAIETPGQESHVRAGRAEGNSAPD